MKIVFTWRSILEIQNVLKRTYYMTGVSKQDIHVRQRLHVFGHIWPPWRQARRGAISRFAGSLEHPSSPRESIVLGYFGINRRYHRTCFLRRDWSWGEAWIYCDWPKGIALKNVISTIDVWCLRKKEKSVLEILVSGKLSSSTDDALSWSCVVRWRDEKQR